MKWLLAIHLLATIGMFGVIWVVQLVHYPLFDRVTREDFVRFEADHSRQIAWVVGPLMLLELATGVLIAGRWPVAESAWVWWTGLALLAAAWLSTAVLSIPEHGRLTRGWDEAAHRRLVLTNWPRTVLWTVRSGLVIYGVMTLLRVPPVGRGL